MADDAILSCFTSPEGPILSAEECARILELGNAEGLGQGEVRSQRHGEGDRQELSANRISAIAWLDKGPETQWLYDRLLAVIAESNRRFWRFELATVERLQFTRYAADEHYDWHMDLGSEGGHSKRKLSLTVQLSEPGAYQGGDLELKIGRDVLTAPRDQGTVTIFPSYVLHRVAPVTGGCRHSLVQWVSGARPFS